MLIISRRCGERIEIDKEIVITIEEITDKKGPVIGAKVKLSVQAPQEVIVTFPPKNKVNS